MPKEHDVMYGGHGRPSGAPDIAGLIVGVSAVAVFLIGVVVGMSISALIQ